MLRFASIIAFAAATTSLVTDCNQSSIFRPTLLALTPDPPVIGEQVLMTVQFTNPGPVVTEGTSTTTITLNGFPITPTVEPLCQNTVCPFAEGANDRSTNSTWPNIKGKIAIKSVWTDAVGNDLLCLLTTIKIAAGHLRPTTANIADTVLLRDDISLKQIAVPVGTELRF